MCVAIKSDGNKKLKSINNLNRLGTRNNFLVEIEIDWEENRDKKFEKD